MTDRKQTLSNVVTYRPNLLKNKDQPLKILYDLHTYINESEMCNEFTQYLDGLLNYIMMVIITMIAEEILHTFRLKLINIWSNT